MPNEIRIENFRDFVEKVQKLEADTYRHRYVFRGEGKYTGFEQWKLTPKIFRQMKDSCGDKQIYRESDLIDAVISRYPNIFKECKSNLEILLLMQHYGLPTRLLDISFNPYIALFFALSGDSSIKEHYVYVIDTEKINEENNKSESKLGARQNKGWEAQKSVFDNTVAVIAALSRLSTAEQDEIKNLKNNYESMKKELQKFVDGNSSTEQSDYNNLKDFVNSKTNNLDPIPYINNYKNMQAAFNAKTLNKEAWDLILIDVLNSVIENYDVMKNLANKTKYYNPGFDQKIKFEDLDNDYIIRPHFSNDRIKNQNGGFLLLNALDKSNNNNVPEKYIDTVWIIDLENEDDRASEVSRQEFLNQLRYMGIDQSFVYPELENFICTDYLEVVDNPCIAIYDISGIQSFIFSTNKLREMVGGSKIVHKILFELLPKKLRYENDNWEDEVFSEEIPQGRFGKVIYIGGGNALVLYKNEESYKSVTIELQKEVFELSGGGIRLCHAKIEIDHLDQKGSFVEKIQKPLMQALTTYKQNTAPIQTARGFAFGAQDNETKEPIVLVPTLKDSPCKYASYGRFKKNEIFYSTRDEEKSIEGISYADNFEQFRDEEEKSFVAVIHIDGNTMGKQIIDFANKNQEEKTLFEQLKAMRELSKEISKIYRDTLDNTVNEIFKKEIETEEAELTKSIPYREIISDGDDITVIIKSNKALQFCDLFVKTLEKEKEYENYLHLKDFHISVGIGIAFVHDKFPFSTAYDIAEQLCKNAKKRGLEYPFSKNNIDVTHSSMDFQIIKSGMTTDIKNFRASNYYLDKNNQEPKCLLRRPYLYIKENNNTIPKEYTYSNFIDTHTELVNLGIANNKLKALQHAYATSEMEIDYVIQMIKARKKCELQPWMGNKATYFDILDVWDYLKGGQIDENLTTDD